MEKGISTYVILGVLIWAIMGTVVAGYYFVQYDNYQREYNTLIDLFGADIEGISAVLEGVSLEANILLNFGNGTKTWHNNTVLPLGSTAFTAIYYLADDINYTDYGGDLGILVTSINGVANNSTHGWFYWYWNPQYSKWMLPEYSSAKHILHKGETIAFAYTSYMPWPPPKPT